MKIIKNILMTIVLLSFILFPIALSQRADACTGSENSPCGGGPSGNTQAVSTGNGACDDTTDANGDVAQSKVKNCLNQSPIVKDIQTIVNFLSAAVGVVVIIMIIVGGVQYTMAGDNASALTAARQRIANAVIALVAFMLAWAFLQWLIPGGIF